MEKTNDPQVTYVGNVKRSRIKGSDSEMVVFSVLDGLFERVFIVPIPDENCNIVTIYAKHKLHTKLPDDRARGVGRQNDSHNRSRRSDLDDARSDSDDSDQG